MPTRITSVQDGPRLTVSELVRTPTVVPMRILDMMDQQFLADSILRPAGSIPSGAIVYHESTPLYANDDPAVIEEFAEIPATSGSVGKAMVARSVYRGLAVKISQRMIDRNAIDAVNVQLTQVRNTMTRVWEETFLALFRTNSAVPTMPATTGTWLTATNVRKDIAEAMYAVTSADADTSNGSGKQKFGYKPDTLIISNRIAADLLQNPDVWQLVLSSPLAGTNPQYTGALPNTLMGLRIVQSWQMPDTEAIVLQSRVVGGIADERPLGATPLYEDKPRETWRSDVTRASALFLDNPRAAIRITGLTT